MEFNEFKDFGLEIILKVLKKTDDEIKRYRELEDLEGVKTLETEVLIKYEKLYEGFISEKLKDIDGEQLKVLYTSLMDIMKQNKMDVAFIEGEMKKREKLAGNSGAEAVRNLYNYQIEELEKKKTLLLKDAEVILDKEATLEAALSEAIQEDEQMEIIEKMPEVRRAYGEISHKIMTLQKKIDHLKEKVEKGWPCDIYGTISKDELMNIFKETIS